MRRGVAGVQLDGPQVMLLGFGPLPIMAAENQRQGGVRLGQSRVERERLSGSRLGGRDRVERTHQPVIGHQAVGIREAGVSGSESRIQSDSMLEIMYPALEPV